MMAKVELRGKHLNTESGMTTFPELATDLDALLAPPPAARPGGL
jgi:predicted alpha/beta hydrolase family esterase